MNEDQKLDEGNLFLKRKDFLKSIAKASGAFVLLDHANMLTHLSSRQRNKDYTVQEIIDLFLKEIPGAPFPNTVDTIKSGSGNQRVTGIVSTMFATVRVINEAAKLGANFIIVHEPTFYNHTDDTNWVNNNQVVKMKQDLLQKNNMAVWRFHDGWHSYKPDGIVYGFAKAMNWLPYYKSGSHILEIPTVSLIELINQLKTTLGADHLRYIGDPTQSCARIGLMPGAAGGQTQISLMEKEKPDVLIVGELHEWETAEYVRDARMLGFKSALIDLGHAVSEEAGMVWLAEWLQPKIPGIKVTHIASKDPFNWG